MRQRDYLQEDRYDMGTSGTVTFNLDYSDPITSIDLLFEATNGASGNKNNPIETNISKIEIVDGGQVLWDLPGDVAFAFITTLRGHQGQTYRTGALGDNPFETISLVFGRELYDEEYGFNPSAHKNPQLKITFNEATTRAAGATGFVSDSFNVSVLVHLMEDAKPPIGFLSCREIETFTSVASGDRRIEMPTDKVIRAIMLRVYEAGVAIETDVTKFRLSVDGGKFVPFDFFMRNLIDVVCTRFKPVMLGQYTVTNDGETHYTWVAVDIEAFVRSHVSGHIATASSSWPHQIIIGHKLHDNSSINGQPIHFGVKGWMLHNTYVYPFGRLDNPEEWFRMDNVNKLDAFLTQGGAGGEVNLCVQSLYRY